MDRRYVLAAGLCSMLVRRVGVAAGVSRAADDAPAGTGSSALHFPADFGAHPSTRIEWWYATGALAAGARLWGFQITFFRAATGLGADHPSRFAARTLIFAHAALTDVVERRFRHDERIARSGFGIASAATGDTRVVLRDWSFVRAEAPDDTGNARSRYTALVAPGAAGFGFDLRLAATQPLLVQGHGGISRKGPRPEAVSHYYSEPQLAVEGNLTVDGSTTAVHGRAWLDHEWSDSFLDPQAVGWDWTGMNLDDGSALTAFRLRRRDGSTLWAGGSFRRAGGAVRDFAPDEVHFEAGRRWTSPATKASYPVAWTITTPAGRWQVEALLDDQELDSRGSTGAIYWEGVSDLRNERNERVGRGYLEMTGYVAALRLGA